MTLKHQSNNSESRMPRLIIRLHRLHRIQDAGDQDVWCIHLALQNATLYNNSRLFEGRNWVLRSAHLYCTKGH